MVQYFRMPRRANRPNGWLLTVSKLAYRGLATRHGARPRRSGGLPALPGLALRGRSGDGRDRLLRAVRLGLGRMVVSEIEAPNMLVNTV